MITVQISLIIEEWKCNRILLRQNFTFLTKKTRNKSHRGVVVDLRILAFLEEIAYYLFFYFSCLNKIGTKISNVH